METRQTHPLGHNIYIISYGKLQIAMKVSDREWVNRRVVSEVTTMAESYQGNVWAVLKNTHNNNNDITRGVVTETGCCEYNLNGK